MAGVAIVDLGTSTAREALDVALRHNGFVQLLGHGLDADVAATYREACDAFFALDVQTKRGFVHADPAANRGYRAKGSEALSYSLGKESPPDLFESFNAGVERLVAPRHRLMQPTPWPDAAVPGFSNAALELAREFGNVARRLDHELNEILGIDWLVDRSTDGPDMLAAINYTPGPDGTEETVLGQQRMGAHSDYTTFTLLLADPVPGLQIFDPAEEWIDVEVEPGALVVNVGDLLAILTNDVFPSTLHRVIPMDQGGAAHRRSVAFFHYPNLDVLVEPLDSFVDGDRRYGPVGVEQHLLGKLVAPKVHRRAEATTTEAGRLDR